MVYIVKVSHIAGGGDAGTKTVPYLVPQYSHTLQVIRATQIRQFV